MSVEKPADPEPPSVIVSGALAIAPAIVEELPEGTLVGDYQIERVIGTGGMGKVYGARHPVIGKRVAIKVLNASYCADRAAVERFVLEAQAVNQIGHANIVDIFAFGTLPDGRSYLIMEWLSGETLSDILDRRKRLPVQEAIAILIPLMRALEAAHAAGVIHRDLKPENVFLVPEDDALRVKLLDFGIAKLSKTQTTTRRTATGVTMGTPLFMSPEQAKGLDIDPRSDAYAVGVMAYLLVCGETPFEHAGSPVEVLHAHIRKTPLSPSQLAPDLPEPFEVLVLELLAKEPEARPALRDARQRLAALAGTPIAMLTPPVPTPTVRAPTVPAAPEPAAPEPRLATAPGATQPTRFSRKRRWIVASAVAAVALPVVAFIAIGDTAARDAAPPPPAADESPPPPAPAVEPPQQEPVPATGTLDLAIAPAAAAVTIDGTAAKLERGRALLELPPGDHVLRVTAPGHRPHEQRFAIVRAQVTPLKLQLPRAPIGTRPKPKPRVDSDAVVNPFDRPRKP